MLSERTIASGPAAPSNRAAQYVRMSTDQQKYSTENQSEVIASYAKSRNLSIVRTYSDEGLSGLSIDWRDGLKSLIADVESGRADYDWILSMMSAAGAAFRMPMKAPSMSSSAKGPASRSTTVRMNSRMTAAWRPSFSR
ncbi:recombinase family protein [Bradyrhizobium sp. UFLA05-153]